MWNKFFGLVKLAINFGEDTKKNKDKIEDLEAEVQRLTDNMTRMAYEIQRSRDEMSYYKNSESSEWEKMALRLENTLLKMGRLPAPKNEDVE